MINSMWFGKNRFYWFLLPLSLLYAITVFLKRLLYSIGLVKSWRAPVPVVIVGNITAGGNGKTPLVIWIAQHLTARGYCPGVVSRGYGGRSKRYPFIVDDQTDTTEAGDEPVLIFQRARVPVAVAPKRSEAAKLLLKQYPLLDLIISDDGLQHYALDRDYEIIVVDGRFGFGNGFWLPAGPMREGRSRLKLVDLIVINGADGSQLPLPNKCLRTAMTIKVCDAVNLVTGKRCPATALKSVVAMAGIGHPDKFFSMLKQMGIFIKRCYSFTDHYAYHANQLLTIADKEDILLMTEKDAVKCRAFARGNWWYLPIDVEFDLPIIDILLKTVFNRK